MCGSRTTSVEERDNKERRHVGSMLQVGGRSSGRVCRSGRGSSPDSIHLTEDAQNKLQVEEQ